MDDAKDWQALSTSQVISYCGRRRVEESPTTAFLKAVSLMSTPNTKEYLDALF